MIPSLEIENRVSLHLASHAARWNINGDKGRITLNLPMCYEEGLRVLEEICGHDDNEITAFIDVMVFLYLEERICIERAHEGIRLKRNHCKPCVMLPIATKMWKAITI